MATATRQPTRQTESARQTEPPWQPGGSRRSQPVQRWRPFSEMDQLNDQFGRLLETVFSPAAVTNGGAWVPQADIEETDDGWVVEAELPSVRRDDINVELRENELTIAGEIKERERKGVLRKRERRTGEFEYRVILPGQVDEEGIEASLHDGVLTVRVPKSAKTRPRKVEVKAA